jgi:acyl-CoA reductase-like NAD-dependent aldehyde dehydrogenase
MSVAASAPRDRYFVHALAGQAGPLPDHMVIGDEALRGGGRDMIEVVDPATGGPIGAVPAATAADVDHAVAVSRRALAGSWARTKPAERARILLRVAQAIRDNAGRLAVIETLDCGKPLREARGDIETAARYFEYYAGAADKLQGNSIPLGPDYMAFTVCEPVGVTAHIVPWNFPLVQVARGVAPALAAGNTVIVKPAEQTPMTAVILAGLLAKAGLPTGVYGVVTGYGHSTGATLAAHPGVNHVTFTGSVVTGKAVMTAAASHVASVTLELGGKSPVVVLADADIDAAVAGTIKAFCLNAGQVCSAGSRLIVEKAAEAAMLDRLGKALGAMQAGHGLDDPAISPIISRKQLERIDRLVASSVAAGAERLAGSGILTVKGLEDGYFYSPTVLKAQGSDGIEVREEIFGPVLTVQTADSPEHALSLANGTDYGLVAGVYTRDVGRALILARDIEAGQIFLNEYFAGGVETPFGGVKNSGFGREKGLEALKSYLRVKCITARIDR